MLHVCTYVSGKLHFFIHTHMYRCVLFYKCKVRGSGNVHNGHRRPPFIVHRGWSMKPPVLLDLSYFFLFSCFSLRVKKSIHRKYVQNVAIEFFHDWYYFIPVDKQKAEFTSIFLFLFPCWCLFLSKFFWIYICIFILFSHIFVFIPKPLKISASMLYIYIYVCVRAFSYICLYYLSHMCITVTFFILLFLALYYANFCAYVCLFIWCCIYWRKNNFWSLHMYLFVYFQLLLRWDLCVPSNEDFLYVCVKLYPWYDEYLCICICISLKFAHLRRKNLPWCFCQFQNLAAAIIQTSEYVVRVEANWNVASGCSNISESPSSEFGSLFPGSTLQCISTRFEATNRTAESWWLFLANACP